MIQSPSPAPGSTPGAAAGPAAVPPVVPERRRRSSRLTPGARRAQLLSTARHLVESGQVRQISVEAVAELAGVSPGLLFHYFGTQRQFRQAVIEEIAADLLAQIQPDPALSPVEQLHAGLGTFIGYVARRPELYLAVIRPADDGLDELHRSMRSTIAAWLVSGLTEAGAPATAAIRITVAGWLAFTEEALLGWINDPAMTQAELVALCERACLHLLDAAAPDAAERRRLTDALGGHARHVTGTAG